MLAGSLARTSASTGGTLVISLNNGAQAEIAAAARRLAIRTAAGDIGADAIDEAAIEAELDTAGLPPLDLLIRTSGGVTDAVFRLLRNASVLQPADPNLVVCRSEEHTSELQSLMRISYAVFCLKKKNNINNYNNSSPHELYTI